MKYPEIDDAAKFGRNIRTTKGAVLLAYILFLLGVVITLLKHAVAGGQKVHVHVPCSTPVHDSVSMLAHDLHYA